MDKIKLKNKTISKNDKVFYNWEAGINHDGSLAKAKELVDVAIDAGVDAVKFQMFNTKYISKKLFLCFLHEEGSLKQKKRKISEFF